MSLCLLPGDRTVRYPCVTDENTETERGSARAQACASEWEGQSVEYCLVSVLESGRLQEEGHEELG